MKKIPILALSILLAAMTAFAHSDAFKPEFVDTLIAPYLAIQEGLAGDDLDAAQTGAKDYLDAMKQAPHEGDAHKEAANLSAPAQAIAAATDIKSARTAFLSLSEELTSLIEHVGTTNGTPLYTAHCPMAFNNTGGSWIQDQETVSNPYYGSMMLRCGSVKNLPSGNEGGLKSEKTDSHHKHH